MFYISKSMLANLLWLYVILTGYFVGWFLFLFANYGKIYLFDFLLLCLLIGMLPTFHKMVEEW